MSIEVLQAPSVGHRIEVNGAIFNPTTQNWPKQTTDCEKHGSDCNWFKHAHDNTTGKNNLPPEAYLAPWLYPELFAEDAE